MADTERLLDFPAKSTPVAADIVYVGDSADSFEEVKSTIAEIIAGYSAALASIAGLTTSANKMIYTTASNVYAVTDLSAFARTILDDANGAAVCATIGALPTAGGTMSAPIIYASSPVANNELVNKAYVDSVVQNIQSPCVISTTADLAGYVYNNGTAGVGATLTAGGNGAFSADGVTPSQNARIFVPFQTSSVQNGVYVLSQAGDGSHPAILIRALDYDEPSDIQAGDRFTILQGTLYGGTEWIETATVTTIGTDPITFQQIELSAYLVKANNLSDVPTPSTARTNLGLAIGTNVQAQSTTLQAINDNVIGANKNIIIGGDFGINPWQRGTSFAGLTNSGSVTYTADRFYSATSGSVVGTIAKASDAPTEAQAGILSTASLSYTVTTAQAVIGAAEYNFIGYRIEGYDVTRIAQRAFTLSFWVKSSLTGVYCVGVFNSGLDQCYVGEYTVNSANTWEKKTITITASPSAGTWDYTTGIGLHVCFTLAAGTATRTTPNAWTAGSFISTASQVNFNATLANVFKIDLVQIEPGSQATGFEVEHVSRVLAKCQRYYSQSVQCSADGYNTGGINISGRGYFKTTMRASPTISSIVLGSTNNLAGSPAAFSTDVNGSTIFQVSNAAGACYGYWTYNASAEL